MYFNIFDDFDDFDKFDDFDDLDNIEEFGDLDDFDDFDSFGDFMTLMTLVQRSFLFQRFIISKQPFKKVVKMLTTPKRTLMTSAKTIFSPSLEMIPSISGW